MVEQRRHRLELPGVPRTDDPKAIQKYLTDLRRLTMDEFNRLATDFFTFKEEVTNNVGFTLAAVANIQSTTTQYSASFNWTLPLQTQVEPTIVRVRIAEFGDTWAEFSYPKTSWTVGGLAPNTEYTFQIQLAYIGEQNLSFVSSVRNCPSISVLVESVSEIRSYTFTTQPGVGLPGDGGGGNTDFPIPDVDGPPGTGGSGTDCHWQWKIQIASETDGTWSDTGDSGTADGDAGTITLDTTATGLDLSSGRVYRLCIREVCDGSPVGSGEYQCGEPFVGDNDWTDACGGVLDNTSLGISPYDTADLWQIPTACQVDGEGLQVIDEISGLQVLLDQEGFGYLVRTGGDWTLNAADLTSKSNYWFSLAWVLLPNIAALNSSDDFSMGVRVRLSELFPFTGGVVGTDPILSLGGGRVVISIQSNGTNWGFQVTAQRNVGGNLILNTGLVFTDDDTFHECIFSCDQDGTKKIILDAVDDVEDTSGQPINLDNNDGTLRMSALTEMRMNRVYGWSRALDDTELPGSLYDTMLAASPLAMWNFNEASGAFVDVTGGGDDVTPTGTPHQGWTSPDGVQRATFTGGKASKTTASADHAFGASGISVVMAIDPTNAANNYFFTQQGSAGGILWEVRYETGFLYVIYGKVTSGLHRWWRLAKTTTEIDAVRLVYVFMKGDSTTPTLRINGAAQTFTSNFGPDGTQASGVGSLFVPGSNPGAVNANLGPAAIYAGQLDPTVIEAAAVAEGWY